ncbi:type I secretion system permease/ATPase [Salinimonas lutimaris]|uniref:type I secretion system permease/ATPase n=1 Tax=Salinimonas lutimaris TaxID=914153 RepID=UPI001E638D1F|nr:type I secretion system permease/ATPase [Salinimonas lutimaris]
MLMHYSSAERLDTASDGGVLMDCLEAICAIHHIPFSRLAVLTGLPLNNGELSPKALARAAAKAGFQSRSMRRNIDDINPALLPAILILHDKKACVLVSVDTNNNTAEVVFPEMNDLVESVPLNTVSEQFTGYVIFVRPQQHVTNRKERLDNSGQGHWFWSVVKTTHKLYRDVIIASIFISLLSVALPLFVMNVYDRVVPNAALETLWVLAAGVSLALVADLALRSLRYYFVELAASRIDVSLSAKLLQKVMGLCFTEKPRSTGALVSSLNSFEAVRGMLNSITIVAMVDIPFAFVLLSIIFVVDAYLAGIVLIGGALIIGYGFYVQKVMKDLATDSLEIGSRKNGLMTEVVGEFDDVRYFGAQNHMQYHWEKQSIFLAKVNAKLRLLGSSVGNLASVVQQGVGVSIIITGVYLVVDGVITQGALIAAYLLSSRVMAPLSATAGLIAQFHHAKSAMEALDELMGKPEESPDHAQWTQHTDIRGEIAFSNVAFAYPSQQVNVLNQASFTIMPGEKVAILGKNGSGKSSVNRMLMKAYRPKQGLITLDGIDLQQYEPNALRRKIGYMPQDFQLFSGTMKENLSIFNDEIHEDDLWHMVKEVGLLEFINKHPEGLHMQVGERGLNLSGGKRQAVALARALIRDPSIFILDEPTSAMDAEQEVRIKTLLQRYTKNKTLILNTHRMAMLDLVDRVILLDKGRVVADGPKNEVMAQLAKLNQQTRKVAGAN